VKSITEKGKNANMEPVSDNFHFFFFKANIPPIIAGIPVMINGPVIIVKITIGPGSAGIRQPLPMNAVRNMAKKATERPD
jgi:hypothetical protein